MDIGQIKNVILNEYEKLNSIDEKIKFLNEIKKFLHSLSPLKHNPCDLVLWVRVDEIVPNDYNPNVVNSKLFKLLYISIKEDGYTFPIVSFYDDVKNKYVIVDGFHRYSALKIFKDLYDLNYGYVPITVLNMNRNLSFSDRIVSTIRHNITRGKHTAEGQARAILLAISDLRKIINDEEKIIKLINIRTGIDEDEIKRYMFFTNWINVFKKIEYSLAWKKEVVEKK